MEHEELTPRPPTDLFGWQLDLDPTLPVKTYRGVGLDRLATVLTTGIDVEPSDSVIFADFIDKAWEYGGFPKVILALDPGRLERTFREIPADTPQDELDAVRERFPNVLTSADGETLWCSRMSIEDPRIASPYEWAYAWWIPGDPFEALRAVLLFASEDDTAQILSALSAA
jgi:hypothetical protein